MQTLVIKARNKSDANFLIDCANKTKAKVKVLNSENLEDKYLISIMESRINEPIVKREKVISLLKK